MDFMKTATTRRHAHLLRIASLAFALGLGQTGSVLAQVPPRFYIDNLSGSNAVPVIFQSIGGNTNPLDPAHVVSADADIQADVAVAGYARLFPFLFDRSALAAVLLPMGHISGETTVGGRSFDQSASGFGDPMVEFKVNVVGPPAIKDIPALLRYEPKFSLNLLTDLAFPVGEYDSHQALNLGQNRWYGRVGAPAILQLGAWVPGQKTTLELLPSVWLFSPNHDYVGTTLETDPMFQLEGHLTRDFLDMFWGSVDASWLVGGKSTIDGVSGGSLNSVGVGFTLGYQLHENVQLTIGYMTTVNDSEADDMRMDVFRFSIVVGWHKVVEGMERLKGEGS
jgi:outer membrane putative beta-barrel porin/alpha-amylase